MGYEDTDIVTLISGCNTMNTSMAIFKDICQDWQSIDSHIIMSPTQASGLTTDIQGYMGSVFTAYDTLSGGFNAL